MSTAPTGRGTLFGALRLLWVRRENLLKANAISSIYYEFDRKVLLLLLLLMMMMMWRMQVDEPVHPPANYSDTGVIYPDLSSSDEIGFVFFSTHRKQLL